MEGQAPDLSTLTIDRGAGRRRRKKSRWGALVWILILCGGLWLFQRPLLDFVDRLRLPSVQVARVMKRSPGSASAVSGAAANGHIVARTRAALSADAPGRLVEVNVVEGSVVKRGDVVARLFHDDYEAALASADASLTQAEASLRRAVADTASARETVKQREAEVEAARQSHLESQAEERLARLEYERVQSLVEKGVETQRAEDLARRDLDATGARVAAAGARLGAVQAAVAQAESRIPVLEASEAEAQAGIASFSADRDRAESLLEKTYVRAPFDGIVVQKEAEIGEVVSPNSQGGTTSRGSVATMVDFASLEVQAEVPETSLSAVTVGGPARVYLDAWPQKPYAGRIDRIWPTADRQRATVEVRVALLERDDRLRPEMGVRVVFLDEEPEPIREGSDDDALLMLVPRAAVVTEDGASGVFVIERDRVRFVPVEIDSGTGTRVTITKGLAGDERVVLAPPTDLADGDRVRTQENP